MKCLLTADWHLRGDAPVCRVNPDEWLEDQRKSVEQLYDIVEKESCEEVWILGDLFHRARTSTEATNQALSLLQGFGKTPVRVLIGNHDMLAHAYSNVDKSTIGAIYSLSDVSELRNRDWVDVVDGEKVTTVLRAYPFGTEPEKIPDCDIWATHQLVFPDNDARPLPDIGVIAEDLLKRSNASLIITGDYHHGYVKTFGDTKVVTCGCLNIQASDMADYKPRCYILDTTDFSVKEILLKTFGKVHPDPKREARQELETYMDGLQDFEVPHLDFIANVQEARDNEKDKAVRDAVDDVMTTYNPDKG
jgi:hypothetical protein